MVSKMKGCFLNSHYSEFTVIGGGSSGLVYSAKDEHTGNIVAVKKLTFCDKFHCRSVLREIRIRKSFEHDNVLQLYRVLDENGKDIYESYEENGKDSNAVYLIQEMMESDLHGVVQSNGNLPTEYVKLFVYQILRGLKYIHSANVVHRDIKPSNILVDAETLMVKIGDFGMSRILDPDYEKEGRKLSHCSSSLWYKAPELFLNPSNYSKAVDIWSVGCVLGEMLTGKTLYDGQHDLEQVQMIIDSMTLTESDRNYLSGCELSNCVLNKFMDEDKESVNHLLSRFSNLDSQALDLLSKMLTLNPKDRISAEEALAHPYLAEYHLPSDEPVSLSPLFIENEVYELPESCLKELIFRESYELDSNAKLNSASSDSSSSSSQNESTSGSSLSQGSSMECSSDKDTGFDPSSSKGKDSLTKIPSVSDLLSEGKDREPVPSLHSLKLCPTHVIHKLGLRDSMEGIETLVAALKIQRSTLDHRDIGPEKIQQLYSLPSSGCKKKDCPPTDDSTLEKLDRCSKNCLFLNFDVCF